MSHHIAISIALHSQTPQFYPSCASVILTILPRRRPSVSSCILFYSQVKLTGTGTGQPSEADLVSIPGLYDGVTFPNIYTDFGNFTIPGPPPVTFTGNGAPSSSSMATPATSSGTIVPSPGSNPTTVAPAPTSHQSNQCLLTSRRLLRRRSSVQRH